MTQAGRNKRDENTAECGGFQTTERHLNNAARARDVVLARCEKEVGARRLTDHLAEELTSSTRR